MAFGKLFTLPENPRTTGILAVAKANNIELDVVQVDLQSPSADHKQASPLCKVPAFLGADGYALSECIAVAIYITSQNEKTTLLGKTKQDYASILKWMSYFNNELLPALAAWYRPLLGRDPYNKKSVDEAIKLSAKALAVVEAHLVKNTFLVGERITLADIFSAGIAARGFQFFFGKDWRQENPAISRWFQTVTAQPIYSAVAPQLTLLDAPALTNVAPKQAPKEAPKPAAKPAPAAEEPAPAPKAKHPIEALPKPKLALDEFKRYYSNNETPDAMKWFWENFDLEEDYSIWKMKFRYNDELTLTFMSNNLIGGLNARLEGSRKYLFGCASVYGENNDSVIQGAFVIRGQDFVPVFDVAPDYESYEFTKLDPKNEEDRQYLADEWTWERALEINGKKYPHADGKVFK